MRDPTQHGDTAASGVRRRAQALVRERLPRGEDHRAAGSELILHRIGDVLGLPHGRGDDEDAPLGRDLCGNRAHEGRTCLRDCCDVNAVHAADGTLDSLGDPGDVSECPSQAREGHAPDARSMPARNSSAKSGRPTRKSVTYGRSRLKLTGLPSTCDAVSP